MHEPAKPRKKLRQRARRTRVKVVEEWLSGSCFSLREGMGLRWVGKTQPPRCTACLLDERMECEQALRRALRSR